MTDTHASREKLAARVVDGEAIDWPAAEKACASDAERGFVRNLRIVTDVARQIDSFDVAHRGAAPTLVDPVGADVSSSPTTPPRDAAEDPALAPGSRWGHLEIIEKIGEGGFGQVYRARDTALDRIVALKLLRLGERNQEERALADGRAMARVRHPNVVTVYGAERIDDRVGIWMDYIDGQTLDALIGHLGPLGSRDAAGIGIELCGALAAVHKAKLVHSDIKAQNVMKEKGGRLVLMDFGAASQAGRGPYGDARISGTPFYMPPEVFEGQPMTIAGDIYALGVLLHHLVTGSFPVMAESLGALRRAHARGEMTLLRDARPDLDSGFVKVVEKALSRDPAARFATMGQMQQALEGAIQIEPLRPIPVKPEPMHAAAPTTAFFRPAYAAMAAGILLVVAGGLWLGTRSNGDVGPAGPASILGPGGPGGTPGSSSTNGSDVAASGEAQVDASPSDAAASHTAPGDARQPGLPSTSIPGGYSISAALYRSGDDGRERLVPGARIKVGDKLHMDVETSDAVHVYVLNHDQAGATFVLFPRPDCDLRNPLPSGLHRLPGRKVSDGIPQDWEVDSSGGREQILILASQRPLADVEELIAQLPAGRQYAQLPQETAIRLRGIGGVAPRPGGVPATDAARLFEDIKRLADIAERASGTWMRQIDLENPRVP